MYLHEINNIPEKEGKSLIRLIARLPIAVSARVSHSNRLFYWLSLKGGNRGVLRT